MDAGDFNRKVPASRWRFIGYLMIAAILAPLVMVLVYKPTMTNGEQLRVMLRDREFESAAGRMVAAAQSASGDRERDWVALRQELAGCMNAQAAELAASKDPFLKAAAGRQLRANLVERFADECERRRLQRERGGR